MLNNLRTVLRSVIICGTATILFFSSCSSYKIAYLKDIPDSLHNVQIATESDVFTEPVIQPSDILQVTVETIDPGASGGLGSQGSSSSASSSLLGKAGGGSGEQANAPGYLVDKNGMVELPIVGKVKVAGLTTAEARDLINVKASEYFKEPIVNVRYANFKVTVLGEVRLPSQYIIPDERVSILDVIGIAGDLTIYGKRDNVLLIRTVNNEKRFVRFDLGSRDIFRSPYFYLRQGDIVYVEPTKAKAATSDAAKARNFTILATIASLLLVILTKVK